ncbi:hypothetical protein AVEN_249505-1, partial [Araneus ventricosus]
EVKIQSDFLLENNPKIGTENPFISQQRLGNNMSNPEILTRALWRAADAVCFDVDSTVCMDEAIDELAKFAKKEKEVMDL